MFGCQLVSVFLLTMWIIASTVWGVRLSDNKKNIEEYYKGTYQTLIHFSATWDRFMQVDEIEKALVKIELDSIRGVLNRDLEPVRGINKKPFAIIELK